MKYCVDCYHMDEIPNKDGLYKCMNSRKSNMDYVSARRNALYCMGFGEAWNSKRSERERETLMRISRNHGYYIVTVISEVLGLDEDNVYLKSFAYMKDYRLPNEFVEEYDEIGPNLAEHIKNDPEKEVFASYLVAFFLEPMRRFIEDENYEEAIKSCLDMFEAAKEKYLKEKREIISKIMLPEGY